MNRTSRLLALTATTALLAGCAPGSPALVVTGTVGDDLTTVTAPVLASPTVNLDAGFGELTGAYNPVTGRATARTGTAAAAFGLGSTVRIASLSVGEGDTVHAGQVLGAVDTGVQKVQVEVAQADAQVARAQVGLLADAIDTTYDKQADVEDARATVLDAIAKIHRGQKQLRAARAALSSARADLVTKIRDLRFLQAHYPPVPIDPPLAAIPGIIAQLEDGLRTIDGKLRMVRRAESKLAAGLRSARSGLRKLADAAARITDARASLRHLKELAAIQAGAMQVPVDAARVQLSQARLVAPVDGVVVSAAAAGEVLAPGATVVAIRETRPSTVAAWLSPAQLAQACRGDSATITGDWMSGTGVRATLTRLGTRADYPPTSVATDEVHLTRAVEVEFTATEQLPAGVPVELSIQPCHPAANNPNR